MVMPVGRVDAGAVMDVVASRSNRAWAMVAGTGSVHILATGSQLAIGRWVSPERARIARG